jgi:hypothetical protein
MKSLQGLLFCKLGIDQDHPIVHESQVLREERVVFLEDTEQVCQPIPFNVDNE